MPPRAGSPDERTAMGTSRTRIPERRCRRAGGRDGEERSFRHDAPDELGRDPGGDETTEHDAEDEEW